MHAGRWLSGMMSAPGDIEHKGVGDGLAGGVFFRLEPPIVNGDAAGLINLIAAAGVENGDVFDVAGGVGIDFQLHAGAAEGEYVIAAGEGELGTGGFHLSAEVGFDLAGDEIDVSGDGEWI